jgi:hypothetical protein
MYLNVCVRWLANVRSSCLTLVTKRNRAQLRYAKLCSQVYESCTHPLPSLEYEEFANDDDYGSYTGNSTSHVSCGWCHRLLSWVKMYDGRVVEEKHWGDG